MQAVLKAANAEETATGKEDILKVQGLRNIEVFRMISLTVYID
jgi:hypothetical protein